MSDLRARIANVLAEAQETHNGISDLDLADAVIRELQLRQEWTWTWPRSDNPDTEWGLGYVVGSREQAVAEGDGRCRPASRWVTDWTADE